MSDAPGAAVGGAAGRQTLGDDPAPIERGRVDRLVRADDPASFEVLEEAVDWDRSHPGPPSRDVTRVSVCNKTVRQVNSRTSVRAGNGGVLIL
jgi:hypothetical protein